MVALYCFLCLVLERRPNPMWSGLWAWSSVHSFRLCTRCCLLGGPGGGGDPIVRDILRVRKEVLMDPRIERQREILVANGARDRVFVRGNGHWLNPGWHADEEK